MFKNCPIIQRGCLIIAIAVPASLFPLPSAAQDEGLTFEQAQTRTSYARRQMEVKRAELKDAAAREEAALQRVDEFKKRYEEAVKEVEKATQAREQADQAFTQARETWAEEAARLKRIYENRQ